MEWLSEFGAIAAMQGFNGLSVFCVLLLMALGLAIIFGQMGVINMAHGEFLTVGAYTTYLVSVLTLKYAPELQPYYFFVAIVLSFAIAGALGWLAEWALISKLYHRPLDTLLATWGLSLVMQQAFRSIFGAREVSATLPDWLMGSWMPTDTIDIPLNGLFVMALTLLLTTTIFVLMYRSRWGLQVRATVQNRVMARSVGINTKKVDRMTFALGCGVAGVAGAAFTTIGSTGPTSGSLYIVDTFLVVVFGGAASLFGTIASAFSIAQTQSMAEFFISGSMAKVLTLSAVILILMLRPQGLFTAKVRK
ncbi:urea ABC transporter permease subunit UrtB [Stutzerimonas sp. R40042]|uniref:urea ABC transporter permease subunit UrtB n=1 Tax=Stutzerimonas TaxID=2901164 RepID=UPI000D7DBDDE|nr:MULTISPECIES: urea ABC transporter permease subunit UrtB [Stutzerimonas]AWT10876.1 urea ABC transporter permease subunit UrtB [Stutzerimonas frequens]MBK3758076.1 urea ABC transporter permease subunit UrtB [Stutzerimonas frequens]MBK3872187.1 urea ABC transporter permease subunit UrtB [Stutzerimonas frequens]MBK3910718.1 urea ABC transporter permease subunit UrtB [Stutzerimonas frequens]MBK3929997.1 urea ABC transporter permease subunit UrtB [Stutzerimonas frequens]